MRYCEEDELYNITDELEEIRSQLAWIDECEAVDNIKDCCRRIENIVDSFREVNEDEDLRDMVPDNLSLGAAISLKETLNKWRSENGYHEL